MAGVTEKWRRSAAVEGMAREWVLCGATPFIMKTLLRIPIAVLAGVLTGAPLFSAVESLKIHATQSPRYSPAMQMDGVTRGQVVFAIDVDEKGQLTDVLVLGYTHRGLVEPCQSALKSWQITPAKVDGVPVPAQTELTIDFSAHGVVISSSPMIMIEQRTRDLFGPRMESALKGASELDRLPARVTTVEPSYAKQAEDEGVRGKVQVRFYIDSSGAVRMPAVEPATHPYLAQMAVNAVKDWKFEPPTSRGRPVLVAARQEFEFGK